MVPRNVTNVNNLTARRKGLQRFWLHPRDRFHAVTHTYNNCAETHLGGGAFCLPVVNHRPSARSNCYRQCSSQERPTRFCSHRSDHCRVLMLTCRNSPL